MAIELSASERDELILSLETVIDLATDNMLDESNFEHDGNTKSIQDEISKQRSSLSVVQEFCNKMKDGNIVLETNVVLKSSLETVLDLASENMLDERDLGFGEDSKPLREELGKQEKAIDNVREICNSMRCINFASKPTVKM